MPTGKEPYPGAMLDRVALGDVDIHERLLEAAQSAHERLPWDEPGFEVRGQIREALELYFGAHIGTPPVTATEVAPLVRAFVDAARDYLRDGPSAEAVDRLRRHIAMLGAHWRARVYRHLRQAERDGQLPCGSARSFLSWPDRIGAAIKREGLNLEDRVVSALPWPRGDECLPLVLECCYGRTDAPRWRDPYLHYLVADLAPIWQRLTGRTPLAKNAEKDKAKCLFGVWIQELVRSAKLTADRELNNRPGGNYGRLAVAVSPRAVYELVRAQRSVK